MLRPFHTAGLAGLVFFAAALPARAGSLPADALPLPNRVATAEMVVVGKVVALEEKPVTAHAYPGAKDKVLFTVAEVKVSDAVLAPKGTTTVRLGFQPIPPMVAIRPMPFQATVGMEGCFFLVKNGDSGIYLPQGVLCYLDKKSPTFEKDVALIKQCVKILDAPVASLKAKDAEERFLAAGMLVARYASRHTQNDVAELIDAEESKLILQALADADWTPTNDLMKLSPRMVLSRLPLTAKDGWALPANSDPKAYAVYAQSWVKGHVDGYRIQRWVADKGK
jgi:hypothetical protein